MHMYLKNLPFDADMMRRLRLERTVMSAMDAYKEARPEAHSEISLKLHEILAMTAGTPEELSELSRNGEAIALSMPLNVEVIASGSK